MAPSGEAAAPGSQIARISPRGLGAPGAQPFAEVLRPALEKGGSPVTAFRRSPVGPKAAPRKIVRGCAKRGGVARAGLQDKLLMGVRP